MGPCAVCGSLTINAAGHCAHCGTYRGLPGQPPAGAAPGQSGYPPPAPGYPAGGTPGYPPPVGGPVQPSSGGPGYPGSGAPGYPGSGAPAYPSSGAPGYPGSGAPAYPGGGTPGYPGGANQPAGYPGPGGYPAGYPAPARSGRNRSFMIPLVALASTLVVLVVAIVVVLVVRDQDDPADIIANPSSTPTAERTTQRPANPDIDECVVGTWEITSHREEVNNSELGKLTFTGGRGGTLDLNADGTAKNDYGTGTSYSAKSDEGTIRLEISGTVTFRYKAVDGRFTVSSSKSAAKFRFYIDEEQYGTEAPFDVSSNPSKYECSGDSLTQSTLLYTITYTRIS